VDVWAGRIDEAVARHAEKAMAPALFADRVRRFRGVRLRELDTPEARAQEAARELFVGGEGRIADLERLDAELLLAAARALRPATLVVLGPFVDGAPAAND